MTATERSKPRYSGLKFTSLLLLALILLFNIANNAIVLNTDEILYRYDLYDYFETALRIRTVAINTFENMQAALFAGEPFLDAAKDMLGFIPRVMIIHPYRPPFFYIASGLFLSLFRDISIDLAVMVNSFFMLILILAVYKTGVFFKDRNLGIMSAFIVTMLPGVFAFSRVLMPEFALMSFVALAFMALLYSKSFTKRGFSLLAGVSMGLGALIKLSYPFFVICPLIVAFISGARSFRSLPAARRTIIQNVFIMLTAALVISLPWYIKSFDCLLEARLTEAFVDEQNTLTRFYYLKALVCQQLFPFFFCILCLSILVLIRKRYFSFLSQMCFCMLIPVCLLYIPQIRESRFTIAMMPYAALLISRGIVEFKNRTATGAIIFISICQFFVLSYSPDAFARAGHWPRTESIVSSLNWRIRDAGLFCAKKDKWWQPSKFAYELIKAHCPADKDAVSRILIFDMLVPVQDGVKYLSFKEKGYLKVDCHARGAVQDIPYEDPIDYVEDIAGSDFIIRLANPDETGESNSCEGTIHYEKCREFIRVFNKQKTDFSLIGKAGSPAGPIEIFKRIDK